MAFQTQCCAKISMYALRQAKWNGWMSGYGPVDFAEAGITIENGSSGYHYHYGEMQ